MNKIFFTLVVVSLLTGFFLAGNFTARASEEWFFELPPDATELRIESGSTYENQGYRVLVTGATLLVRERLAVVYADPLGSGVTLEFPSCVPLETIRQWDNDHGVWFYHLSGCGTETVVEGVTGDDEYKDVDVGVLVDKITVQAGRDGGGYDSGGFNLDLGLQIAPTPTPTQPAPPPEPREYMLFLPLIVKEPPLAPCQGENLTAEIGGVKAVLPYEVGFGETYDFGLWGLNTQADFVSSREVNISVSSAEMYKYHPTNHSLSVVGIWPLAEEDWISDPVKLRASVLYLLRFWYFETDGARCSVSGWIQWDPPESLSAQGIGQTSFAITEDGVVRFDDPPSAFDR